MEKNRLRASRYLGFLKMVAMAFAFLVTFNCSTAFARYVPGQGWVYGIWPPPSPKDPQNPATFYEEIPVGCHDAFTMAPLDCPFSISIAEDPSFYGGHTHSRIMGTGIGTLSLTLVAQFNQLAVQGQTGQSPGIIYEHPEMSGGVVMKGVVPAPPGYVCLPDGSLAACTVFYHIAFQVLGLVALPPSVAGEYVLTGQNASNQHTENHYGTPKLVAAIQEVAKEFKDLTTRSLGVNDMSLQWGGLYDYHNTGFAPHNSHRKGTSVDIDSVTVKKNQDINQNVDTVMQKKLTDLFIKNGCEKVNEEPIHYECK